ncbi:hypothetical protein K4A83_14045 [Spirulina subsalsa FACHB-351]|uniref:SH3 domain-containing protein n=1 Tax=Spirulina subsalsa FACHB-351 TaxID=234711 RepID=A0ABT3L7A2_9CYAN|nr:hypothetical protein [Spirulina subsalsa]MCW6037386.1 hypothetical protein [Spirulina subsalsa FACHB-351]
MKYWKYSVTVLAVLGSVLGTETAIALNQSHRLLNSEQGVETSAPTQLAQSRFDRCRRANTSIFIYRDRSPERPIATVQANEQVQLAEQNPVGGWIAVNEPVRGFVEARFLTQCDDVGDFIEGSITQIMSSRLCVNSRPSSNAGLPIYSEPRTGSRTIDRVFRGEEVTATNYSLDRRAGRLWLRISRPVPGWVDYGNLSTGEVNFIPCALQN